MRRDFPATADAYVAALEAELRALGATDVDDEIAEIRSHLADATAGVSPEDLPAAIAEFGGPAVLARSIIAERTAAVSLGGAPRAGRGRIALGWTSDILWVLFMLPLTFLSAGPWFAFAVHDLSWRDLTTLSSPGGLDPLFAGTIAALALVMLLGVIWTVFWTFRLIGRRRSGLSTVGMRAVGVVMLPAEDGVQPVTVTDAVRAGMPPIRRRALAVGGVVLAAVGLVAAFAWIPVQRVLMERGQRELDIQYASDEADWARWQKQTQGWVSELYEETQLKEDVPNDELASAVPDLGVRVTADQYATFIREYRADTVKSWRFVHLVGSSNEDTLSTVHTTADGAIVTVAVTEVMGDRNTIRNVVFCFRGTVTETEIGADESWQLVAVWRDPPGRAGGSGPDAEEAREAVASLIGLWGVFEEETQLTERFAATEEAKLLLSNFGAYDPDAPEIGFDLRVVEGVRFDGEAAVVRTTEGWMTREAYDTAIADGARWFPIEERRYEYRVIIDRGLPMVDARTRID